MSKAQKKVATPPDCYNSTPQARARLRRLLDEPGTTRAATFKRVYEELDRAQLSADPVAWLKLARQRIDDLIAIYSQVRR